jgi:hypothetical protein
LGGRLKHRERKIGRKLGREGLFRACQFPRSVFGILVFFFGERRRGHDFLRMPATRPAGGERLGAGDAGGRCVEHRPVGFVGDAGAVGGGLSGRKAVRDADLGAVFVGRRDLLPDAAVGEGEGREGELGGEAVVGARFAAGGAARHEAIVIGGAGQQFHDLLADGDHRFAFTETAAEDVFGGAARAVFQPVARARPLGVDPRLQLRRGRGDFQRPRAFHERQRGLLEGLVVARRFAVGARRERPPVIADARLQRALR